MWFSILRIAKELPLSENRFAGHKNEMRSMGKRLVSAIHGPNNVYLPRFVWPSLNLGLVYDGRQQNNSIGEIQVRDNLM